MSSLAMESVVRGSRIRLSVLLCGMSTAAACTESEVDALAGEWSGEIICSSGRHDLTVVLEAFGERLSGDAFTRSRGLNKAWRAGGGQTKEDRDQPCSNDTCTSNEQCAAKGGSTCDSRGRCLGCNETVRVAIVELTLEDDDIQLVNPTLNLLRMGDARMEGTIESFCPVDDRGTPTVTLSKQ